MANDFYIELNIAISKRIEKVNWKNKPLFESDQESSESPDGQDKGMLFYFNDFLRERVHNMRKISPLYLLFGYKSAIVSEYPFNSIMEVFIPEHVDTFAN